MGFVGKVMDSVSGIKILYIIGILIFIVAFVVVLYKVIKMPKKDIEKYKNSILDQVEP